MREIVLSIIAFSLALFSIALAFNFLENFINLHKQEIKNFINKYFN